MRELHCVVASVARLLNDSFQVWNGNWILGTWGSIWGLNEERGFFFGFRSFLFQEDILNCQKDWNLGKRKVCRNIFCSCLIEPNCESMNINDDASDTSQKERCYFTLHPFTSSSNVTTSVALTAKDTEAQDYSDFQVAQIAYLLTWRSIHAVSRLDYPFFLTGMATRVTGAWTLLRSVEDSSLLLRIRSRIFQIHLAMQEKEKKLQYRY